MERVSAGHAPSCCPSVAETQLNQLITKGKEAARSLRDKRQGTIEVTEFEQLQAIRDLVSGSAQMRR